MDLSNYVRVAAYDLPEPTRTAAPAGNLLGQEASAVTYNWDTNTLFITGDGGRSITQVSITGQLIDTMTLPTGNSPQGTEFYDTEGLTYIGNGKFVMTEERTRQVVEFTYAAGTTLTRSATRTVDLGTDIGNVGLEGISYDPLTGGFILVKEKDALGLFQTNIDFANGTATNGSPTTVNSANLFNPALVGTSDLSDVYALSSNASFLGTSEEGHLLILSQESGRIVEIDRNGVIHSQLQLVAPNTSTGIDLAAMTVEGITMGPDGTIYLVSEEGGGDANHPQLWVYKPAFTGPNAAPTGVSLTNATSSILENSNTAARIKVADIAIADDGQGTNSVTLSGADASFFEVDGTSLYLKAGTSLNFEAKKSYAVTVNVDDATVGTTPDASTNYVLNIGNIVNEGANGSLAITEIAPWSSGTSIGSDWFELTNTGGTAISLNGWKMDDNSYSNSSAVALSGVSSIGAGESVIFLEVGSGQTAAGVVAAFKAAWFGGNVPANLQIGTYSGSGVGLSTSGDAVAIFDNTGTLRASIAFGAAPSNQTTFDNTAQLNSTSLTNHVTVTATSVAGTNGAAAAVNDASQIGSPGKAGGVPAPVNQVPTAIGLTGEITTLPDDTSTGTRVKVASIIVNDDGLGTNILSLSGADASFFEVDATGLYLKAGVTLDATNKAHYDVTVNVDDVTVGATPDASVSFSLDLTHVVANAVRITEVAPWSSGNSPFGADWFEVTNTGSGAVNIAGWKVDDSSAAFANAVSLNGVSSIGAHESVIFVEGTAATAQAFINTWFGGSVPQGIQVGWYSGSGIGLSTGGDAVNLYNASGALQASVSFGSSPSSAPYATFDNSAGLDNVTLTTLSSIGANGAFNAAQDNAEIGSPGRTSAPSVPDNQAPTAITLNNVVTSIEENSATGTRIKVADIAITDDGLGINSLTLSGADAAFFEVDATGLYLKAGTSLDFEAKTSYAVTVNVDDATVGTTPDASTSYVLTVTDVANEPAPAQIRITEVAPWSSGNSPVAADWFEITNTGTEAVNLAGWKVDDSSYSFASAVALNGVSSIGAGQSVIFIETTSAATVQAFINLWFGGTLPGNVQIGTYSGSGIGLSTGGDGLILFNASGAQQAKVSFGSSPSTAPYATFDNSAGLDNVALTVLSTPGVNGAGQAPGSASEIGSPGTTVNPNHAPVANDDTGTGLIEDQLLTATGHVLTNDTDADNDTLSVAGIRAGTNAAGGSFTALSGATLVQGLYGILTIHADGSYSYALDNANAAVQALNTGEHLTENFTYQVQDTHGATAQAQLSFDIAGTDDGPLPIVGTDASERLDGTDGNDIIMGLAGLDRLYGGAGDDILIGGEGGDQLYGAEGNDTASYEFATKGVYVSTTKGFGGEAAEDKLFNIENLTGSAFDDRLEGDGKANVLKGGAGNDIIYGGAGDDVIEGGSGVDYIHGGKGVDLLTGGAGADRFAFEKGDTGKTIDLADTITDFEQGFDLIDLSLIDANSKTAAILDPFTFIGTAAFTKGTPGQLRYEVVGNDTYVTADFNGDAKADLMIHLVGQFALTTTDFLL